MEHLITRHLDIWTGAQTEKRNGGRGRGARSNGDVAYGIKKLRELILELAVRGKLVPQDPNDEPASELLKRIAKEKQRLIKEGKIKRQKALPEIGENEKPFELPKGWEWCRLGELFEIQDYLRIPVSVAERERRKGPYPYYGANGQVGVIDDYIFEGERILLAEDGGFFSEPIRGVAYIVDGKYWVNNHAHVLRCFGGTCAKYWRSFFNRLDWEPLVRGMTRAKLNQAIMAKIPLSVPPLSEQHRIVAKVDELMALCDQLEQQQTASNVTHQTLVETLLAALTNAADPKDFDAAWRRIAGHFDTLFTTEQSIDLLKQTILQLAVMGKLVPQDPDDEPASVLLKKIAKEKQRMIKEGKIKKQKALPKIGEEEKPFELPEGWEWVRFGNIGEILGGGTPNKSIPAFWDGDIPWISPKDMKVDYISDATDRISVKAVEKSSVKIIPADSLLIVVRGMILSHSFPVAINLVPVTINQDMKAIVLSGLEKAFMLLTIKGLKNDFVSMVERSTHGTCKIVSDKLWKKILAIPPLPEQHRIVAKVDELMALCDTLKARLNAARTTRTQLADAMVAEAIV